MKHDLKSMTRKQLEKLRSDVDVAIQKLAEKERKAALQAAEKAARAHGFTLAEITDSAPQTPKKRKTAKKAKAPSEPKYANPSDASQTWTGKGRQPDWFKAALASGKDPQELEI